MDKPWYEMSENLIYEIENEDYGLKHLVGHQTEDGSWEYAIVSWVHRSCHPIVIFRNGKTLQTTS